MCGRGRGGQHLHVHEVFVAPTFAVRAALSTGFVQAFLGCFFWGVVVLLFQF